MLSCGCDDDEGPSVFREKLVKARKNHKCCECNGSINKGDIYEYTFGVWEGKAESFHTCEKCSDLRESMQALGFCVAYGNLLNDHVDYKARQRRSLG